MRGLSLTVLLAITSSACRSSDRTGPSSRLVEPIPRCPEIPVSIRGGDLQGRVRDDSLGAPISGAHVRLSGAVCGLTFTDHAGTFAFARVPAGRYTLTTSFLFYSADTLWRLTIREGSTTSVNVRLRELDPLQDCQTNPRCVAWMSPGDTTMYLRLSSHERLLATALLLTFAFTRTFSFPAEQACVDSSITTDRRTFDVLNARALTFHSESTCGKGMVHLGLRPDSITSDHALVYGGGWGAGVGGADWRCAYRLQAELWRPEWCRWNSIS